MNVQLGEQLSNIFYFYRFWKIIMPSFLLFKKYQSFLLFPLTPAWLNQLITIFRNPSTWKFFIIVFPLDFPADCYTCLKREHMIFSSLFLLFIDCTIFFTELRISNLKPLIFCVLRKFTCLLCLTFKQNRSRSSRHSHWFWFLCSDIWNWPNIFVKKIVWEKE